MVGRLGVWLVRVWISCLSFSRSVQVFWSRCCMIILIHFWEQNSEICSHSFWRSGERKEHLVFILRPLGVTLDDKYSSRKNLSHFWWFNRIILSSIFLKSAQSFPYRFSLTVNFGLKNSVGKCENSSSKRTYLDCSRDSSISMMENERVKEYRGKEGKRTS